MTTEEHSNESLHLRISYLEHAQAEIARDLKSIQSSLNTIIVNTTQHFAQACPKPGECLVLGQSLAITKKDLDNIGIIHRSLGDKVESLRRWQTGLIYAYTLLVSLIGLWLALR